MSLATPQNMTAPTTLAERLAAAHRTQQTLVTAFLGGTQMADAGRRIAALGIPNFVSPGRAVNTLRAMTDYASWGQRPPRIVTRFPVNRRRVDRVLVTNGVYAAGGANRVGNARVVISNAVQVESVNGPSVTMIQGASGTRCAYVGDN